MDTGWERGIKVLNMNSFMNLLSIKWGMSEVMVEYRLFQFKYSLFGFMHSCFYDYITIMVFAACYRILRQFLLNVSAKVSIVWQTCSSTGYSDAHTHKLYTQMHIDRQSPSVSSFTSHNLLGKTTCADVRRIRRTELLRSVSEQPGFALQVLSCRIWGSLLVWRPV